MSDNDPNGQAIDKVKDQTANKAIDEETFLRSAKVMSQLWNLFSKNFSGSAYGSNSIQLGKSQSDSCTIRGAIRTIVSTSTENLVAGDNFSIFIKIENPFETALTLHNISTNFPTEFIDVDKEDRKLPSEEKADNAPKVNDIVETPWWKKINSRITIGLPFFEVELNSSAHTSIARDAGTIESPSKQKDIVLQPGNSTTRNFTVRTRRNLFFNPSAYKLHIIVEYSLNGLRNIDTIEHSINVRASLFAIITGSILGGFGGWLANRANNITIDIPALFSLVASLALAIIAAVLFARKKDIQPIIAVEDFWGGIMVGFISAYSGPKFIENLIGSEG